MNFGSDNMAGAAPEIIAAIAKANDGMAVSYGADPVTERLAGQFDALFERKVWVFPIITGTAANSITLAAMSPPWGAIYCHEESHVNVDECGGPEFYTGGAKLIGLAGEDGKIDPKDLAAHLKAAWIGVVHAAQPAAVSITQGTECGTVYSLDEIAAVAAVAKEYKLALHMDGARFANAVAYLGCSPADATWRAGVDALSFGASKNGALGAEAIVVFREDLAATIGYRRKRAGHLLSKMRYCSAQLEAYIADGLWLKLAGHANAMAKRLADGLAALPGIELAHPAQSNGVFARLPEATITALLDQGFFFYRWGDRKTSTTVRLMTTFETEAEAVDRFVAAVRRLHNVAA
jgi:threonine aldolase